MRGSEPSRRWSASVWRIAPSAITLDVPRSSSTGVRFAAPSPNPARHQILLQFALPSSSRVRLGVYDTSGRRVYTVASSELPVGSHSLAWDLRDTTGQAVNPGVYFAVLEVEGFNHTRRFAVVR